MGGKVLGEAGDSARVIFAVRVRRRREIKLLRSDMLPTQDRDGVGHGSSVRTKGGFAEKILASQEQS